MKTINSNKNIIVDDLLNYLQKKVNPLFQQHRQSNITFNIVKAGDEIEINQPEVYDDFLFRLSADGNNLSVTKSEHYVDDVNVLTLESILDILFTEYLGTTAPQL
ncbi:hypothetical protein GCM10023149_44790 [Mucilaginibacter gynuensis]|uniref:Uncharacterized protein n=1 Tax=Mucilaginibacter gynuensis TaxID=1302236 RepID=A0ABP8H9F7_9SPHI